jgi:hypothetical protein
MVVTSPASFDEPRPPDAQSRTEPTAPRSAREPGSCDKEISSLRTIGSAEAVLAKSRDGASGRVGEVDAVGAIDGVRQDFGFASIGR